MRYRGCFYRLSLASIWHRFKVDSRRSLDRRLSHLDKIITYWFLQSCLGSRHCFTFSYVVETQRDKEWSCQLSPCQNGGTCKPGNSKCVCRLGYVGQYCECKTIVVIYFLSLFASTVWWNLSVRVSKSCHWSPWGGQSVTDVSSTWAIVIFIVTWLPPRWLD